MTFFLHIFFFCQSQATESNFEMVKNAIQIIICFIGASHTNYHMKNQPLAKLPSAILPFIWEMRVHFPNLKKIVPVHMFFITENIYFNMKSYEASK